MILGFFHEVSDVVEGLAPDGYGELRTRATRGGVKVWFGAASKPAKVHYEAQYLPRRAFDGGDGVAIEIGFHAELADEAANQAALDRLLTHEKRWRRELGPPAEAGTFLGRDSWRRISEVWLDTDIDDPELVFEVGSRLVDYVMVLEPLRNS